MTQAVIIKSNRYGIQLILDPELPFDELLAAVAKKFQESKKFFRDASLAIAFEGRELTQDESLQIIDTITANSDISIICIIDEERSRADMFRREIAIYYDSMAGKEGEFYIGDLKAGQTLENDAGIIIVGDVEDGAKVISDSYIIVMGALKGEAEVRNKEKFITALEMNPSALKIGDAVMAFEKEKEKKRRRREKAAEIARVEPQMAFVKGLTISIETVTRGMLDRDKGAWK